MLEANNIIDVFGCGKCGPSIARGTRISGARREPRARFFEP